MKKLLLLLPLFGLFGCINNGEQLEVSTGNFPQAPEINYSAAESEASYNVNIYDNQGEWFETGLLIESFDNRSFVQIDNGRYELLASDKEDYRYMIETEEDEVLYVK